MFRKYLRWSYLVIGVALLATAGASSALINNRLDLVTLPTIPSPPVGLTAEDFGPKVLGSSWTRLAAAARGVTRVTGRKAYVQTWEIAAQQPASPCTGFNIKEHGDLAFVYFVFYSIVTYSVALLVHFPILLLAPKLIIFCDCLTWIDLFDRASRSRWRLLFGWRWLWTVWWARRFWSQSQWRSGVWIVVRSPHTIQRQGPVQPRGVGRGPWDPR